MPKLTMSRAELAAPRRVIRTTWLIVGYISQYITVSGRERGAFGNVLNVSLPTALQIMSL